MFAGDSRELTRIMNRAFIEARMLRATRTGSEHLLLALSASAGPITDVLSEAGADRAGIHPVVAGAGPSGAGAAADRALLATVGVDLPALLSTGCLSTETPPAREPLLPLGVRRARQRCASLTPAVGMDVQAAYEASLRLALARRERAHRPEHLALTLVAVDPGVAWVLERAKVQRTVLLQALAAAFPPPVPTRALRVGRALSRGSRARELTRRYEHAAGRCATAAPAALDVLITGSA